MNTSTSYNGHKNWNHWNVALWINNDEGLYRLALDCIRRNRTRSYAPQYRRRPERPNLDMAARDMFGVLTQTGDTHTPDGAPYSVSAIRAAMRGMQ